MDHAAVDNISQLLDKSQLVHSSGVSYRKYRRELTPRYGVVWLEIVAGWLACSSLLGLHLVLDPNSAWAGITVLPFAMGIGFAVAYLQLFLHESAHHNLHPKRGMNDLLTNLFISGPVGMDVARYRPIHFDHHRFLGSPDDTEISYFDPLNIRFLVESLLGVKVLRVLRSRSKRLTQERVPRTKRALLVLAYGAALNGALVLYLARSGRWFTALVWILGLAVFFPFFGALRQLLEHRDEYASADVDYTKQIHGAIHRLFGDGLLASTLGGAGFNRHLLHHWDPQVSCTRLRDLERFLLSTDARSFLEDHSTTYWRTFRKLFHVGHR